MRDFRNIKNRFFILCMFCCLLFSFISCSDVSINISTVYPQLVYEYTTKTSAPDVRLSVYAEVSSGSDIMQTMIVKNTSNNMVWTIEPVDIMTNSSGKKKYAGYSAICMPADVSFEKAVYQVIYEDLSGKKTDALFSINPDDASAYGQTAVNSSNKQYMVVDQSGNLLYTGSYNENFSSAETVRNAYPDAAYYREYVLNAELNAIYLMPAVNLKSE